MHFIKTTLAILISLLCYSSMWAQVEPMLPIKISGKIEVERCDSVRIRIHPYSISSNLRVLVKDTIMKTDNGYFEIGTESNHPIYMQIYPLIDARIKGYYSNFTGTAQMFVCEPNDSVFINIDDKTMRASGRGQDKYNLIADLWKYSYYAYGMLITRPTKLQTDEEVEAIGKGQEAIFAVKSSLLESRKYLLSDDIYRLMKMELEMEFMGIELYALSTALSNLSVNHLQDISKIRAIKKFKQKYLTPISYVEKDTNLYRYSSLYSHTLFNQLAWRNKLREPSYWEPIDLEELFELIVHNYSGILRDRLLVDFISTLKGNYDVEPYLDRAAGLVSDPEFAKIMDKLGYLRTGKKVTFFSMPDSSGRYWSLDDFRGKYTLIDLWYTGCIGCIQLARAMTKDIARWQDDPRFQMVSISIDSSKDKWLQSLRGGKYTHPGSINLRTEELGGLHPFIKSYDIGTFPTLMLIDPDGKLLHIGVQSDKQVRAILDRVM
ncbi:TlpA family protein disulfide reductase [Sphingobacterium sp. SYP-B4668]|uniref:TlpA family protein disulfide reductase n=1 Tax=Sphingobacterium sp. SYP-B4668 TaxID=2996035 RepID=UPI0022DE738A|nr:TlpA disulfide reductase family protein [Sphingobacterium sp. SYP-B4668]